MKKVADYLITLEGHLENGEIVTELPYEEVMRLVNEPNVVIVKNIFPADALQRVIDATLNWSKQEPLRQEPDDFVSNAHKHRLHISNIQQSPQLFHDHTFDNIPALDPEFQQTLLSVFTPMTRFWNRLTGNSVPMGIRAKGKPYFHPQITHYPLGGSFFGRHWHPLNPQQVGLILALNQYGQDYHSGGTGYVINDTIIETEGHQNVGDMILFRYDLPHWVSPSSFADRFSWDDPKGRWVAIIPFYDPWGTPAPSEEPQGWKTQITVSEPQLTEAE